MAVINTLTAVTTLVLNLLVSRSLNKLEIIVPKAMIVEMIPAQDTGTLNWGYIECQAEPNKESGRPKLIKAN